MIPSLRKLDKSSRSTTRTASVLEGATSSGQDPLTLLDPARMTVGYLFVLSVRGRWPAFHSTYQADSRQLTTIRPQQERAVGGGGAAARGAAAVCGCVCGVVDARSGEVGPGPGSALLLSWSQLSDILGLLQLTSSINPMM